MTSRIDLQTPGISGSLDFMTNSDLHVVIHVRRVETTAGPETIAVLVAGPTDWRHAQQLWERLDAYRRCRNSQTTRKVHDYYAVRSVSDPLVQPLLQQCSYHSNQKLAAQAWGRDNEVKGNKGGWIFLGSTQRQGWDSASLWLKNHHCIGLAQHPKTGKTTWINYGSPLVRPLADSRV